MSKSTIPANGRKSGKQWLDEAIARAMSANVRHIPSRTRGSQTAAVSGAFGQTVWLKLAA